MTIYIHDIINSIVNNLFLILNSIRFLSNPFPIFSHNVFRTSSLLFLLDFLCVLLWFFLIFFEFLDLFSLFKFFSLFIESVDLKLFDLVIDFIFNNYIIEFLEFFHVIFQLIYIFLDISYLLIIFYPILKILDLLF